jgi:phenylacetate-coenzyme A ligase PaaK-like adenylate-forming protein
VTYRALVENVILPVGDMLIGGSIAAKLREYRRIQWYSRKELLRVQADSLRNLLQHAAERVPYYGGIRVDASGDPFEEIRKFPVMRKEIIKNNLDAFTNVDKRKLLHAFSSGSSGEQGVVYYGKDELSTERAIQILWWEWAGYRFGQRTLQTGMTVERGFVKSAKDFLLRTSYYPAYDLQEKHVLEKLEQIRTSRNIRHLMGYASSLYVFAETAQKHDIRDVHFESVVSWGDKMFPHFRRKIEQQFHTRVFDTYGCTEGCMIAAQCECFNYHIMSPHVYLEIVNDNGAPVPTGHFGNVVVTRLDNYSMPLIRYYLGDLATLDSPHRICECGRSLPLLKQIVGRDTDIVRTRSGKHMIVHFFTGIFEFYPQIKQFRVVQKTLDEITIEYIPDIGFTPAIIKKIHGQITSLLQEDFPVRFIEVDQINPTPSGKPQIVQSLLPTGRLECPQPAAWN